MTLKSPFTLKWATAVVAGLMMMAASQSLWAQSITVSTYQDASLFQTTSGQDVGTSDSSSVIAAGDDNNTRMKNGLIEFSFTPGQLQTLQNADITSVTLTLYLDKDSGTGPNNSGNQQNGYDIGLFAATSAWHASAANATNSPGGTGSAGANGDSTWQYSSYNTTTPSASGVWTNPNGGGDHSTTESATTVVGSNTNTAYTWSSAQMVTDVDNWVSGNQANYGWEVINTDNENPANNLPLAGGTVGYRWFYGDLASLPADAQYAPELTIDYTPESSPVPEPASLTLAGLGLLSFAAKFRNRFARKSEV